MYNNTKVTVCKVQSLGFCFLFKKKKVLKLVTLDVNRGEVCRDQADVCEIVISHIGQCTDLWSLSLSLSLSLCV